MSDLGRVAIAHEWVSARAGSEKVFEELGRCFPEADLYAMTVTPGVDLDTGGRPLRTTMLDRTGPLRDRRSALLPAMPLAWRYTAAREEYDTVITSSHACVKGFRPGRNARHFSYVHAPMRYVWDTDIDGRGAARIAAPARAALRRWDRRSADWVDSFAANSSEVADRIRRYYGRDARVIHPPVDTEFFSQAPEQAREGLVTLGRFIPYKGHDLAIRVAAELDVPIRVVGKGPEEGRLRALASELGAKAEFIVGADDHTVRDAVASAQVLVFAAVEDFGIVPVEAQAAGTPVVGPAMGGLRDTVKSGVTGVLAPSLTLPALATACESALNTSLSTEAAREHAGDFGIQRFNQQVRSWLATSKSSSLKSCGSHR